MGTCVSYVKIILQLVIILYKYILCICMILAVEEFTFILFRKTNTFVYVDCKQC